MRSISSCSPRRRRLTDNIETERFSNGLSATPIIWNAIAVWQQTTGSTSMTFGKSSRSLSARLAAVLFYWFVLLSPAAMSLAETPAQTEREEESTTWNVERLIDSL